MHRGRDRFSRPPRGRRYSWARYYHPGLQRFISEDPIGLLAGDTNYYAYVDNNPLSFRDPQGLFIDPVTTALGVLTLVAVIAIINPDALLPHALTAQKCEQQYVVRGGISEAKTLQRGVDSLAKVGHPGLYGISSSMGSPGMRPEDIAMIAKFQHPKISYTTVTALQNAGFRIIPTPGQNPLHSSIIVSRDLSDVDAGKLSALFQQNIRNNPAYGLR